MARRVLTRFAQPTLVTSLPPSPVDGQEAFLSIPAVGSGNGSQAAAVWHMRYNAATSRWEQIGGAPITFRMDGENEGYVAVTTTQAFTVNAALTKWLQWAPFTPPVDVW